MNGKLLILEDDQTMRRTLGDIFRNNGMEVHEAEFAEKGLDILRTRQVDVALVDMNLPDISGLEFWKRAREMDEGLLCVFMTAFPEIKTAVAAMREGAFDYINKPFELDELKIVVNKAFEHNQLRSEVLRLRYERDSAAKDLGIMGHSDAIKRVNEQIYQVAGADTTPVLILGESGTGKELVADALHNLSGRKEKPFLKLNCSAIPETLLESELFGHERGSFTDAKQTKKGVFEMADTGSLFLDEIGDMAISIQPKLLRALESKTLRRVGGTKDITVNVRMISATNKNVAKMVEQDSFRADLLYRLNVFSIHLPPLRERISDIPLLADHFAIQAGKTLGKNIKHIEKEAMEKMKRYSWPGNVRELKNVIERACILTTTGAIRAKDLRLDHSPAGATSQNIPIFSIFNNWLPLEEVELRYIKSMLEHCGGNKSEAARQLDISRVTLREKLRKLRSKNDHTG